MLQKAHIECYITHTNRRFINTQSLLSPIRHVLKSVSFAIFLIKGKLTCLSGREDKFRDNVLQAFMVEAGKKGLITNAKTQIKLRACSPHNTTQTYRQPGPGKGRKANLSTGDLCI